MRTYGSQPQKVGTYCDTPPCPTPTLVLSPHTRLKLRPQDSSAVSTRFLSAENIFRMLMQAGGVRVSWGAKITKVRAGEKMLRGKGCSLLDRNPSILVHLQLQLCVSEEAGIKAQILGLVS